MAFPRRLLNEGEDLVLDLRPHWWMLARPVAVAGLTVVAGLAVRNVRYLNSAVVVVIGAALLWLALRYVRWATTHLILTTDRLIHRRGVLARHGREIPLERINDLSVTQRLFDRLIGAGELVIESAGERGQQHFEAVPRPFAVQNVIHQEMEAAGDRDAARVAGMVPLSVPEQLEKLDELCRRGVISRAEFEAKKAQLLDRL